MIRLRSAVRRARRWRSRRDRGARLTNERIRAWLNERDEPAPFFAFVNYMESHEPYEPPYPHNGRFTASGRFPWRAARPSKREILASPEPTRSAALEAIRARYDGTVSYLDERVGELLRYLDDLDVLDDTVVVVTSDHGDSIGEHGHLGHRVFLHEQLVRVPLIIRHPARFGAGVRVRRQVQLGDLFPTVLELAGADDRPPVPPAFPSLFAPVGGERRSTFAENTAPKAYQAVRSRMIREDRFKLISSSNGVDELYDLVEDPGELQNLVGERRDVVERLRAELAGWERSLDRLDIETEAEYDEEVLERLRGLGYLE